MLKDVTKYVAFWKIGAGFKAVSPREVRALTHWKILMAGFLLMTLAILFTSVWIYRDIGRGEFFSSVGPVSPKTSLLTKDELDSLANDFETRRVTFEQVKSGRSTSVVDPSR